MPRPDPLPRPPNVHFVRLKRGLRLLTWFALAVAIIATLLVTRGQAGLQIHMMIATFVGMGLVVFIGGALMLLIFYSAASGHDDLASRYDPEDKE
ncbi:MAG: hypothetical protein ABIR25_00800 [Sphingomicrobium sp.]